MSVIVQRSFATGEITPSLYARIDIARYLTSLRTCRNYQVMKYGGAQNRAGTGFIGEVKDSSKTVRLIPFIFNSDQTYVLEFGDQYMRVIRNEIYQYDLTLTITGVSNANPGVVTYTGTDPTSGQEVYISGIVGAIGDYLNGRNFKIANVNGAANTFELQYLSGTNVDTSAMGSYTSGGTAKRVYTIVTPYLEADLPELNYTQSADVVTLVHPSYAPRDLSRTGHTAWSLDLIVFAPTQAAPTGLAVSGTAGANSYTYHVTAYETESGEESLAATVTQAALTPPATNAHTITWVAAANADEYYVYLVVNGVPQFLGTARGLSYVNSQNTGDEDITPPTTRTPFGTADNYPSAAGYYQQRRVFANTNNDQEKIWTTRTGNFNNLTISSPLQDDDAVTWNVAGSQVNEVRNLLDIDGLIVMTSGGEWSIFGGADGVLRPGEVNPKQKTYYGSSYHKPVLIGSTAVYVQARQTILRDLFNDALEGYKGNDLTLYSAHLFEGYAVRDLTFQQIPNSIVWVARSDGTLLGMTYIREQQFLAWHRHDFDGTVEQVCVVPEGSEDALYLVIKRTINGATKRYVERMKTRFVSDLIDAVFVDCSLSYDGRNEAATTMTLSGGTDWTYTETLTLTASASFFTAADVGNQIFLYDATGDVIRFTIDAYTSGTVVTGRAHKDVPTTLQAIAVTDWSRAVDSVGGLWHLEGKEVSVFADEFVVANPNNSTYTVVTVTNGAVTLDQPYAVIHVGLPITADLETLDIDSATSESMIDKQKLIGEVVAYVQESRGLWAGGEEPTADDDFKDQLNELQARDSEDYDDPIALQTGVVDIKIEQSWNSNGRIFIRQTDPLPLTILAVAPKGFLPAFKGA